MSLGTRSRAVCSLPYLIVRILLSCEVWLGREIDVAGKGALVGVERVVFLAGTVIGQLAVALGGGSGS